jgi:hypothetical protein
MIRHEDLARLVEAVSITRDQLFEQDSDIAGAPCFRRWAPLAPFRVPVVEEQPLDDDSQVRAKGTAALELADNRVVVFDKLQLHVRREVLCFGRAQTPSASHEIDDALDRGELGLEEGVGPEVPPRREPAVDYIVRLTYPSPTLLRCVHMHELSRSHSFHASTE